MEEKIKKIEKLRDYYRELAAGLTEDKEKSCVQCQAIVLEQVLEILK